MPATKMREDVQSIAQMNAGCKTRVDAEFPFTVAVDARRAFYDKVLPDGKVEKKQKKFKDVIVTTAYPTGPVTEVFTLHYHRGEFLVSVAPLAGLPGPRESLQLADFVRYAVRRWRSRAAAVLSLVEHGV